MPAYFPYAFLIGIISAGVFFLVANLGLGFFFLFLPTLPLLYTGFCGKITEAFIGSIIAAFIIAVTAELSVAIIYLLFLAGPACYVTYQGIRYQADEHGVKAWISMGRIFANLSVYCCAIIGAITLYYAGEDGGIAQILANYIRQEFAHMKEEYGEAVNMLAEHFTFLVFALTSWFWAFALYIHVWMAHKLITHKNKQLRPHIAIEPFILPNWLLGLLAISALASLIGSPSMQLFAKSSLITLMLPYFLLGCAIMHRASQNWPTRRFLLFFIYFMIFAQFWPALVLVGLGFFEQIKSLSDRPTSTKS